MMEMSPDKQHAVKRKKKIKEKLFRNRDGDAGDDINWRKRRLETAGEREEKLLKLREEVVSKNKAKFVEKALKEDTSSNYTLSIAIPGSFLNNGQSAELRSYMAGQVARAATIFGASEIVIYDETSRMTKEDINSYWSGHWSADVMPSDSNFEACFHLAKILEYLECPQYLRKRLFPFHKALKFAGLLNPLDANHHLKSDDLTHRFREGVILNKPIKKGRGPLVDIGLDKEFQVEDEINLPPDTRVTVEIKNLEEGRDSRRFRGSISSAKKVREATGMYWGYAVRLVTSLKEVLDRNRYDVIVGTSPRGSPVADMSICALRNTKILIVFGGVQGVDAALESEELLEYSRAEEAFDRLINSLPSKGTRTERVEENILITLSEVTMRLRQLFS